MTSRKVTYEIYNYAEEKVGVVFDDQNFSINAAGILVVKEDDTIVLLINRSAWDSVVNVSEVVR